MPATSKRRSRKSPRTPKRSSRRRSARFRATGPQLITRPGSKPGLVDVIEVDRHGNKLRTVEPDVPYSLAVTMIQAR